MTSHLSISYVASPPAGSPKAAAGAGVDAPADSPLGFLSALIDQLLAGNVPNGNNAAQPTEQPLTAAAASNGANVSIPGLLGLGLGTPAPTAPDGEVPADPAGKLVSELDKILEKLKAKLDAGETPDPDLLDQLTHAVDALAAFIAAPTPPATTPPVDSSVALDPLKAIEAAGPLPAASPNGNANGLAKDAAQRSDRATAVLAALGLKLPDTSSEQPVTTPPPAGDTPAAPAARIEALTNLTAKLTELTEKLAPKSPQAAEQIERLVEKLTDKLAALTPPAPAAKSDLSASDSAVEQLVVAKPTEAAPAALKLSTANQLPVTDIAPPSPKPAAEATIASPQPDPKPSAPERAPDVKLTVAAKADVVTDDPKPKLDAKLGTEIAAAATTSSDTDTPSLSQPSAGTSIAPAAAPATSAPKLMPAAYQTATNPINVGQVAFEMVRQIHQGTPRFSIRLDPPELGRVDVKMHVDASGTVNARLTVERSETLDMFQRDQRSLERALTQAGLDGAKTNLEFSLKQNPFAGMAGNGQERQHQYMSSGSRSAFSPDDDTSAVPSVTLYRGTASAGGINLFV